MRRLWRWVLVLATVGVLAIAAGGGWVAWSYVNAKTDTVGKVDFDRPLAIPPLAESHVDEDGRRVFDLTMETGSTDLGRGAPTPTWGVNGSYLGPTVRADRGEEVLVNVSNELGEPSTLHWHGMHLPARMDGGPHQMVAAGDTWSPTWRLDQPAATLWYHPHPHGETADHVYRGLAGLFLVDDPDADVDLPDEYGVDDIPLIVQDKLFDGSDLDLDRSFFSSVGVLGDTVLVNGTPGPYLDVTTERVRLRLLNASNARIYDFHFADDRSFAIVGSDGGLLPAPVDTDHVRLSPGERAEIVVTVRPGERTVLRSQPLDDLDNRFAGTDDRLDILELRAGETLTPTPDVPATLADAPDLSDDAVAQERVFRLSGTSINGKDMDMDRIDLAAELDTTERWRVSNAGGNPHNFHVHDVQFQVESLDGAPPPPGLAGWKDTVLVRPGSDVVLRLRFTDYADPDAPYMFHCHLLLHEDRGMMGQFVVVRPGEEPGSPGRAAHHDH